MTLDEVKKLITNETDQLEFKSTTGELQKACKTLCAFLNNHGGTVLIGVKDDGRLVGQVVTDKTRLEIANEIRNFEPPVSVEVDYIPMTEEKFVISMKVPASNHRPYIYDGRPYHRIESSTSIMPQHLYEQLLVERGQLNHAWDEFISSQYTIDDLDHDEIRHTVKLSVATKRMPEEALEESISEILMRLQLVQDGWVKNAAVVLYAKKIISSYSQCMIKMARFRGLSTLDGFSDNQQIEGNAFKILSVASAFMDRHLNVSSSFSENSFYRVDKL